MSKKIVAIPILFFTSLIAFCIYRTLQVPSEPVHYHANFAVFEEGKQVDFSTPEFMHISPCIGSEKPSSDPKENVHLHDGVGNVVHLHAEGITWKMLFENLRYWQRLEQAEKMAKLAENYRFEILIDEKSRSLDDLAQTIQDRSHLLVAIGSSSADLKRELSAVGDSAKDYDEGKVGIEKCGSDGKRNLWQRFKIAFDL